MAQGTCFVSDCGRLAHVRGLCVAHYNRWYTTGVVGGPIRHKSPAKPIGCAISGCEKPGFRREWCVAHYSRWQRTGDPLGFRPVPERAIVEFERLVLIETDDCILWVLGCDDKGYGRVHVQGGSRKTHQWALERHTPTGRPEGLLACHKPGIGCAKNCMNYRHLYWGTNEDNMRDKIIDGTSRRPTR